MISIVSVLHKIYDINYYYNSNETMVNVTFTFGNSKYTGISIYNVSTNENIINEIYINKSYIYTDNL